MDAAAGGSVAREIALCWLAHALTSVARRVCVQSPSAARVELISVTPATDPKDTLVALVRALHSHEDVHDAALSVTSVSSIQQLLPTDPVAFSGDANADLDPPTRTVKLVIMEMEHDAWEAIQSTLKIYADAAPTAVWLLVGVTISQRTDLLVRFAPITSSPLPAHLHTALQPLRDLAHQCGLPLALELLTAIDPTLGQHHNTTASTATIPKVSHLPFQLLVMLLRWSYFHPRVVSLLAAPLIRKLTLTPQRRIQHEILDMFQTHHRLWTTLYHNHPEHTAVQTLLASLHQPRRPHHLQLPEDDDNDPESGGEQLPPLSRLSQCALWDLQKQFYRDQGIHAWSHHLIPFGVSSSSFLARQYARLAVDFFTLQFKSSPSLSPSAPGEARSPRTPNCYVWEAASGSCKFLHAFLLHFYELVAQERLEELLGVVPCVVASDLSDQVLQSREEMACFQQYIADQRLDFALFDTDDFLDNGERSRTTKSSLYLRNSQRMWRVGVDDGPVFIVGNYFLDSLRSDVFVVTEHSHQSTPRRLEIREALIDSETDTIPDMLFSLHKLDQHPRESPVYGHPVLDTTLAATLDQLDHEWKTIPPPDHTQGAEDDTDIVAQSSLLLFPVEAIRFLDAVLHKTTFPVAFVAGDATFSFRDAVPSSFIDHDTGDLEIPQLSPHPDCFCLPVDFEILQQFVVSSAGSCASIVASPSSDTFNVFFAQSAACISRLQSELQLRFREGFDRFSPCDCDLIWGMMRVDAGTASLSFETQLALLAQTAYDFDVFSVVQWGLLHHWKEQTKKKMEMQELELVLGSTRPSRQEDRANDDELERVKRRLVAVGAKSQRTFYVMDEHAQSRDSSEAAIATLQLARWFYELGDWETTTVVLADVVDHDHPRLRAGSLYLLGLTSYHSKDFWAALSWFRKGLQLEPTRLRLKKWIARTLLRLQELKQRTSSSATVEVEQTNKTTENT